SAPAATSRSCTADDRAGRWRDVRVVHRQRLDTGTDARTGLSGLIRQPAATDGGHPGETPMGFFDRLKWWARLPGLVQKLQSEQTAVLRRVHQLEDTLREHVTTGVDVPATARDSGLAIVVGRYRNHDYVRVFELRSGDFSGLVDQLRAVERVSGRRYYDTPPQIRGM